MKACKDPNKMEDLMYQLFELILENPKYRGYIKEAKKIKAEFEALPYDFGYEELDINEILRHRPMMTRIKDSVDQIKSEGLTDEQKNSILQEVRDL